MADNFQALSGNEISAIFNALNKIKDGITNITDVCQETATGRYLTDNQLSEILHVSKRTLANYRAKGEFGYYDLPGKILYDEAEIEEFLQRHYLPPFRIGD